MKRKTISLIILIGLFFLTIIVYMSFYVHVDGYVKSTICISVTDTEDKPIEGATVLFLRTYEEWRWNDFKIGIQQPTELLKGIKMVKTVQLVGLILRASLTKLSISLFRIKKFGVNVLLE